MWRFRLTVSIQVSAYAILALALPQSGRAAEFFCLSGDVTCLIAAINEANVTPEEEDTIFLEAGSYTLTAVDNDTDGPNGLPSITSNITIQGASADLTVVERDGDALRFRIFHVAAEGSLTLAGLSIMRGSLTSAPQRGGGIFNNGMVTITDCILANNDALFGGGGILNGVTGTLTIAHSTITRNFALLIGGGGIRNSGILTIADGTISSNVALDASPGGGGILNEQTGILTITSSTIANNTSVVFGGGGILNNGMLTITNSTIAGNRTSSRPAGGISNGSSATAELQNTILALNTRSMGLPSDCSGSVTSLGNNLIGDTTGCTIDLLETDITGDPGLEELTDDGTPGRGHFPLLADSQAIDGGNDEACPPNDQLGQERADGDGDGIVTCDIGAVEFQPALEP